MFESQAFGNTDVDSIIPPIMSAQQVAKSILEHSPCDS